MSDNRVVRNCAVCARTLLMGERSTRYARVDGEWVDVCALCRGSAVDFGWVKEGAPTTPLVPLGRRRLRFPRRANGETNQSAEDVEAASGREPNRVSCFSVACETFNDSAFHRTVAGVAKSLGTPWASLVYLTGSKPEVVITVAWELSWYQYRVVVADTPTIRLAERGYELDELDARFMTQNASFDAEMTLVADRGEESPSAPPPAG
jgi:hypothetical protein